MKLGEVMKYTHYIVIYYFTNTEHTDIPCREGWKAICKSVRKRVSLRLLKMDISLLVACQWQWELYLNKTWIIFQCLFLCFTYKF